MIVTIQADYHNELLLEDYLNICRRITDLLGGPYNFYKYQTLKNGMTTSIRNFMRDVNAKFDVKN